VEKSEASGGWEELDLNGMTVLEWMLGRDSSRSGLEKLCEGTYQKLCINIEEIFSCAPKNFEDQKRSCILPQ
jgi:hypothetical protein